MIDVSFFAPKAQEGTGTGDGEHRIAPGSETGQGCTRRQACQRRTNLPYLPIPRPPREHSSPWFSDSNNSEHQSHLEGFLSRTQLGLISFSVFEGLDQGSPILWASGTGLR